MYEYCNFASAPNTCGSRLQRLGQAGFRVVVNNAMLYATAQQVLDYADAAQAAGLQLIWPLYGSYDFAGTAPDGDTERNHLPALAQTCRCNTNEGLLAYVISLARSRPNTWGYYLADEPGPDAHDSLRSFVDRVKALDPARPRIVMGCGVCGPQDPRNNLSFLSGLDIHVGTDAYPVRDGPPNPQAAYDGVAQAASALHRAAAGTGRGTVMAVQAWTWGDSYYDAQAAGLDAARTRFPTADEIRMQRDAAIANAQPGLILWFALYDVLGWEPGQRPSYWADPSDPEQRWNNLVQGAFAQPAGAPQPAVADGGRPTSPARKPVPRFTLRVSSPPARIGTRVLLDARRSYDPGGKRLRYRWTLNGHGIPKCPARACSLRPHRSGTQSIALWVDNGKQRAVAVKRLNVRRRLRR